MAGTERADAVRNRAAILRATEELLARQDVDHVSVDAVAAAAGVGKGTVFRRFGSRAGLLRALVDDRMDDLSRRIRTGPPPLGPGAPAVDRLTAFFDAVVDIASRNSALISAYEYAAAAPQRSAASQAADPGRPAASPATSAADADGPRGTTADSGGARGTTAEQPAAPQRSAASPAAGPGRSAASPADSAVDGGGPRGTTAARAANDAYAWWYEHLTGLIAEARPDLDAELVGHVLLGSLHAPPIRTLLAEGSADRVRDTMRRLATDLLGRPRT